MPKNGETLLDEILNLIAERCAKFEQDIIDKEVKERQVLMMSDNPFLSTAMSLREHRIWMCSESDRKAYHRCGEIRGLANILGGKTSFTPSWPDLSAQIAACQEVRAEMRREDAEKSRGST